MTPEQMWWYMDQLKRKRAHLETDHERVERLLQRPNIDRQERNRLKMELDHISIQLAKVKRGLLY